MAIWSTSESIWSKLRARTQYVLCLSLIGNSGHCSYITAWSTVASFPPLPNRGTPTRMILMGLFSKMTQRSPHCFTHGRRWLCFVIGPSLVCIHIVDQTSNINVGTGEVPIGHQVSSVSAFTNKRTSNCGLKGADLSTLDHFLTLMDSNIAIPRSYLKFLVAGVLFISLNTGENFTRI